MNNFTYTIIGALAILLIALMIWHMYLGPPDLWIGGQPGEPGAYWLRNKERSAYPPGYCVKCKVRNNQTTPATDPKGFFCQKHGE